MTAQHPDFDEEQAYIDHAYACLEASRSDAWKMRELTESGTGGTFQNRFERNAIDEALAKRLTDLDLGDAALVFGRIDRLAEAEEATTAIESFHIGRLALSDANREPIVVDWRAPVAEPFYRATGRDPMGLARRRHFVVQGRTLQGIEDELFGGSHLGVGHDDGLDGGTTHTSTGLRGYSTLLASIERGRSGQLGDIVATIQAEQDEIIRSPQGGVLVVQGGPGTGKTVVALHRAAYLLYTNRFPLEDQGVLVIGPNRVFLRYIERVLPSLGEAGVEQVILQDLVPDVRWITSGHGVPDAPSTARVKGDERMSDFVRKAVKDRQRPLREDVRFAFGRGYVRLRPEDSERIIKSARRRFHRHNPAVRWVENEIFETLAASLRDDEVTGAMVRDGLRGNDEARALIDRIWPRLTPAQLLHDLFGSKALLRLANAGRFTDDEVSSLYRSRSESLDDVRWTAADAALLDEARVHLGPMPNRQGKVEESDEIRTYGHIVVDEVQDLSPMQLAMVTRRSLSGSLTVVGDLAQATGAHAPDSWNDVLDHLPERKPSRVIGLSVGYRIPGQIMELATRVMHAAAPGLVAPRAVREGVAPPRIVAVDRATELFGAVVAETRAMVDAVGGGNVAVVVPDAMAPSLSDHFSAIGFEHGRAATVALDAGVTIVPVGLVKGLELDGVVVVEPTHIVAAEPQGMRALYVALTRSTQRLTIVHAEELPAPMRD